MYLITISFTRRNFELSLWQGSVIVANLEGSNAAKNLIINIDMMLKTNKINLDAIAKIAFLSGPGSFTSARIVCATCVAIQQVCPSIIVVPVLVNEAIHSMDGYANTTIFMRCNLHTWHVYQERWSLVSNQDVMQIDSELWTSLDELTLFDITLKQRRSQLPWPDLSRGIMQFSEKINYQKEAEPFYGLDMM